MDPWARSRRSGTKKVHKTRVSWYSKSNMQTMYTNNEFPYLRRYTIPTFTVFMGWSHEKAAVFFSVTSPASERT